MAADSKNYILLGFIFGRNGANLQELASAREKQPLLNAWDLFKRIKPGYSQDIKKEGYSRKNQETHLALSQLPCKISSKFYDGRNNEVGLGERWFQVRPFGIYKIEVTSEDKKNIERILDS